MRIAPTSRHRSSCEHAITLRAHIDTSFTLNRLDDNAGLLSYQVVDPVNIIVRPRPNRGTMGRKVFQYLGLGVADKSPLFGAVERIVERDDLVLS